MISFVREIKVSLIATAVFSIICGGIYPVAVWVAGRCMFPARAGGSILQRNGVTVGSLLVGQKFVSPRYFHPRPSAAGEGYDATRSGGSNLGPLSRRLVEEVGRRAAAYRLENALSPEAALPADAVTASGSGLDPHISLANALAQVSRVAKARGWADEAVLDVVRRCREGGRGGIFGELRINVLRVNLLLDAK
jgi:K+-transporting ATPase ATPase C chain